MFEFIWDGKPDKIKRKILTQDYEKGGLKMIDIDKFLLSLKASWVNKLFNEHNSGILKRIYQNKLNKYGGKLILECNLTNQDISHLFKNDKFLQAIIQSWNSIYKIETKENVKDEILWNNRHIKTGLYTIFYEGWYNKGIKQLQQLYDFRFCRFFTFEELCELYSIPVTDNLKYNQLISCIPKEWKIKLQSENTNMPYVQSFSETFLKSKYPVKFLNKHQTKSEPLQEIKSEHKWNIVFEDENLNWNQIYTMSLKCTIDQKLRNFQYKFLMQIVRTNDFLLKCNLVQSNLCDFCNMNIETVKHLFWECVFTQHFWNELANVLNAQNLNISITFRTMTFGVIKSNYKQYMINHVILSAKYFIYICKLQKTLPIIYHFKRYLKNEIELEKQIALNHNKIESHNLKWQQLNEL